jgi:UDP-2,3-diacylglucosamine hydrolase
MAARSFTEIVAPTAWRTVDLLSDLHLQAGEPATFDAWRGYLETTPADAIFILGDLFELWIGDDAADRPGFEAQCARLLRQASERRPVFFMHGNRDFLVGASFAQRCGMTLIDDPALLVMHGQRWVLSHGDALCLGEERRSLGRSMRARSEDRKRDPNALWFDVDRDAALDWLRQAGARTLVHGHTHRPGEHVLDARSGERRIVLSDWDAAAHPPRAQVLCLSAAGARRVDLR